VAGQPVTAVPRPDRSRGHGRIRRLQNRRDRSIARGDGGDGSVPRRRVGRREAGSDPSTHPAADLQSPRPHRRPLYGVRRTLRTRFPLLSGRQQARLTTVFADDNHLAVLVTWSIYQRLIAAYSHPDRRRGKTMLAAIIDSLRRGVPAGLEELAQLGRTLHRRRADVLAYFDHHVSNGPTEAINGRLEALRRNALGSATSLTTDCAHCCTAATSSNRSTHSNSGRDLVDPGGSVRG